MLSTNVALASSPNCKDKKWIHNFTRGTPLPQQNGQGQVGAIKQLITWMKQEIQILLKGYALPVRKKLWWGSPFKETEMDLGRVYVLFRHHGKTAYSHLSSCARFLPDFTKSTSATVLGLLMARWLDRRQWTVSRVSVGHVGVVQLALHAFLLTGVSRSSAYPPKIIEKIKS